MLKKDINPADIILIQVNATSMLSGCPKSAFTACRAVCGVLRLCNFFGAFASSSFRLSMQL